MRLPRTMVINGERWRVVRKPLIQRGDLGFCSMRRREIQVCTSLRGTELLEVFLHEVMHACMGTLRNSIEEETLITRSAPRLLEALAGIGWVRL